MKFSEPYWFLLLLLIPLWIFFLRKREGKTGIGFSSTRLMEKIERDYFGRFLELLPLLLRVGAFVLFVMALARPYPAQSQLPKSMDGLDIMLAIDTSGSMRAQDFVIDGKRPTRIEVIKKVIGDFIEERTNDRIGLVVFGTEAFTQAPLTFDHDVLREFLDSVEIGVAGEATAIGDGIAVATNRLKDIPAKGKIIILLTDGANNSGRIDPLSAADAARALGIRIYTIGVGGEGQIPIMQNGMVQYMEVDIDEPMMEKISEMSGAKYFRAKDTDSLKNVYKAIDQLEKNKTEAKVFRNRNEQYHLFLWAALALLLLEQLLGLTRWRRIPA